MVVLVPTFQLKRFGRSEECVQFWFGRGEENSLREEANQYISAHYYLTSQIFASCHSAQ